MYYEQVFKKLSDEGVDYLVVGGVALVLHGAVRLTIDLDLMLLPEPENLQKFVSAIESLGFKPKLPMLPKELSFDLLREWKRTRNLQVLSFYDSSDLFKLIDILIDPAVDYKEAAKDRKIFSLSKVEVPVISIKNLKKLKEDAGRPKDLEDIASLDKVLSLEKQDERR